VVGSPHRVATPGFVNSHHHVGLTPFQLGSLDYPLELWFASRLSARPVDPYLDTLHFRLRDDSSRGLPRYTYSRWLPGPASLWPDITGKILQAYADIGMRVS
jgi:cytosine/adenosine deaminase-related metal-dependent hydrolase